MQVHTIREMNTGSTTEIQTEEPAVKIKQEAKLTATEKNVRSRRKAD